MGENGRSCFCGVVTMYTKCKSQKVLFSYMYTKIWFHISSCLFSVFQPAYDYPG